MQLGKIYFEQLQAKTGLHDAYVDIIFLILIFFTSIFLCPCKLFAYFRWSEI